MKAHQLPPLGLLPPRTPGTFAVLPLPLDLGGQPGTGAGAAWLGRHLAHSEVRTLTAVPYEVLDPMLAEVPFARMEPWLYAAAVTGQAWRLGYRPLWLFGDHGPSYGPVRAAGLCDTGVSAFVFDAHYDRLNRLLASLGHGCGLPNEVHQGNVATWIGNAPNVERLVQVGIRQPVAEHELDPVHRADVLSAATVHADLDAARRWLLHCLEEELAAGRRVVLSIDVDVLDPEEQPAVDHPAVGGLSLEQLLSLAVPIAQAACSIDLAELNPLRDRQGRGCRTALNLACALLMTATAEQNRPAWLPVLGPREVRPLAALGPYSSAVVKGERWFEPGAVEAAILDGTAPEALEQTFTTTAIRGAAMAVGRALAPEPWPNVRRVEAPFPGGPPVRRLGDGERHVEALAVSGDATRIAAGGWDSGVYWWDLRSSEPHAPVRVEGHSAWVVGMAFSPSQDRLATVSDDHTVRVWAGGGDEAECVVCTGHAAWVKAVAWSPDGSRLASAGFDGSVRVWDPDTGAALASFAAHPDAIWGVSWSPDGGLLATCGDRGLLRVWDAEGRMVREHSGHLGSVERCRFDAGGALWSLGQSGLLACHVADSATPALLARTGLDQGLDLLLLDGAGLALVAGERTVRCLRTRDLAAVADLEASFTVGAIAACGSRQVAIGGDAPEIAIYDLPEAGA